MDKLIGSTIYFRNGVKKGQEAGIVAGLDIAKSVVIATVEVEDSKRLRLRGYSFSDIEIEMPKPKKPRKKTEEK